MELKNITKKRFVSDFNLPINILEEPYFSNTIEMLDKDFNSKQKLLDLKEAINILGSENLFLSKGNEIIREAQDIFLNHPLYNKFKNNPLEGEFLVKKEVQARFDFKKNLYVENFVDKEFISIDLKEANFNALKIETRINFKDYNELISSITDLEYFRKSKHIRQVIFGSLMPKKQVILEEAAIFRILNSLDFELPEIIIINKDEVIFEVNMVNMLDFLKKEAKSIYPLRIEQFILKAVKDKNDKIYFYKDYGDKKEVKGVPKTYYNQAFKKINGLKITSDDLVFSFEGHLAEFKESLF